MVTKGEELGVVCEENWSHEYRMALSGKEEGMNQRRLRILICDIDPDILIHLEKMLEDAGFDTTSTWNVVDLERLLQQHSFQLVIIGDHPSQMDAELLVRKFRGTQEQVPNVLCLVWHGHVKECTIERLRSAGATAVVSGQDDVSILEQVRFCLQNANFDDKSLLMAGHH